MGRAKLYDPQTALSAIKGQFRADGFEGTSLQDLEIATGLPKQTLYREFGDKRQMYLKALADYERTEIREAAKILFSVPDAYTAFRTLFSSIIDEVESAKDRRGCFLCNASADQTLVDHEIGSVVSAMLARWREKFDAKLGDTHRSDGLADALLAGYVGLRILIRAGLPVSQLRALSEQLLLLIDRTSPELASKP